jgi:uncharacterized protein
MKVAITGSHGLIGSALSASLRSAGHDVVPVARSGPLSLTGVDAVVNLAGEPIAARRWSDEQKRKIHDSRVDGTRRVVEAIERDGVPVLLSGSGVGYYGDRGDEVLTEESSLGEGFLAEVCRAWEAETKKAEALGVRVVSVRIGVVLAKDGGALATMLPLFKAGIAGPIASGGQWMPWLHIDDAVGLLIHAATTKALEGPMNACAPEPATNKEFTKTLGAVVHRPTFIPVPKLALKALYGEMGSVVLASQRVVPSRALATGYVFRHSSLREALESA